MLEQGRRRGVDRPDLEEAPDSGAESETDAVGVTADTVKISMIYADLSALSEQNLAPEIGSAKDQAEAVVAEINENGGVAGRQIELVSHVIEGAEAVLSPEAGRAACLAATEDDKPFAVVVDRGDRRRGGPVRRGGARRADDRHGQLPGVVLRGGRGTAVLDRVAPLDEPHP